MHITQWIDHCSRWRRELAAALAAEPAHRPLPRRWEDEPRAANEQRRCADRDNRQWRDTEPHVADVAP
jgi:negative regulator of sigma E activity